MIVNLNCLNEDRFGELENCTSFLVGYNNLAK